MTITKLNWQEPTAYILSISALIVGTSLNVNSDHNIWLTPSGSFVIVIGVLLASSRKMDVLNKIAINFADKYMDDNIDKIINEIPKSGDLNKDEIDKLKNGVRKSAHSGINENIDERRRVFKLHEVFLVSAGTLINGWGDLIYNGIMCSA